MLEIPLIFDATVSRIHYSSLCKIPGLRRVWDAGVYYLDFTTDTKRIIIVRKTPRMGAHLRKMPLRLPAPDPPDLRALFQIDPIQRIAVVDQQEIRCHLAQILSRLRLIPKKGYKAVSNLINHLQDDSSIVKTL